MLSHTSIRHCAAWLLILAPVCLAGPDHNENGDAGSTSVTAQPVFKYNTNALTTIAGSLGEATNVAGLDLEDMYLIRIVDPMNFSASTRMMDGGMAAFDSQLWLFRPDAVDPQNAFGLLANNDSIPGETGSYLRPPANDATGAVIPSAGEYLLAITAAPNSPLSASGAIFQFKSNFEISGPDGPGGQMPHIAWTGTGPTEPGAYVIYLTGAEAFRYPSVPAISSVGVVVLAVSVITAGWFVLRRRATASQPLPRR